MTWFLLIGIFCVLAVIGFFVTGSPFKFAISGIVFLIALVFIFVVVLVVWTMNAPCSAPFTDHNSAYCQNRSISTSNSVPSNFSQQTAETSNDPFLMNDSGSQYSWYDKHNVAMAYRCYPGGNCTAQDWAYAIYDNKDDPRGTELKQQADLAQANYVSQFPVEKCVTEIGVKICDLSNSVKKTYGDGTREVNFQANAIDCINVSMGKSTQFQGNDITIDNNNTYCASDLGSVYIDPTILVGKYFDKILRDNYNSPYYVSSNYTNCIWTYADGNGAIPYIEVSNNIGPSTGFNVKAFCRDSNNEVDIFSYKDK